MVIRAYNEDKDKNIVFEILNECGWVNDKKNKYLTEHIKKGRTIVSDINERVEAMAVSVIGDILYKNRSLPFSAITGVTVALTARKRGLAKKITAKKIQDDASEGAAVCGLSFFDQGFYDKLGFGSLTYHNTFTFTPATLNIKKSIPIPIRLSAKNWKKIHNNRLKRMRLHGSINLPDFTTKADIYWEKDNFGFGFVDEKGALSHHIWMIGKGKEKGPYRVHWMAYRNYEQFLDLLALLKSLGDQIMLIRMDEPPQIQLQDFISSPFFYRSLSRKSNYENGIRTAAWNQLRILDLKKCILVVKLEHEIKFNLKLTDPIENFLSENNIWNGVGGEYIVKLGKHSTIDEGRDNDLQTMEASIGAFSRLWMGVRTATSLSVSDDLYAPENLLRQFDDYYRLLAPNYDWEF